MSSQYLLSYRFDELVTVFAGMGLEKYRAKQVWEWIFKKGVFSFSKMSNLPANVRDELSAKFPAILPPIVNKQYSSDKTTKILLSLHDGAEIESVAIPSSTDSMTFCVSSQVGCPVSCSFCRTGKMPFKRNLSAEEIVVQVLALKEATRCNPGNIVLMGMGEPFLNRENVFSALDMLTDSKDLGLASRRITVSTVGIPHGITQFAKRSGEVNLAVSIHSTDKTIREKLIPFAVKYPIEMIREAIVEYIELTNRRVTFEYTLLRGINDGFEDALNLVTFCEGLLCHVNIVRFNPFPECSYKASTHESEREFKKVLKKAGVPVTVRASHGGDILAACGQLGAEKKPE
ncbi:MAG: 23S rRNA (adenine(2503)-C(2))-methyltransferase RlmN [Candidatus Riflebacteria bacterium]|nr:23S rRNA (adenine(2503)-C(2))-methyltransferase RlmN [Candidatus Riflebacteria bacterium]